MTWFTKAAVLLLYRRVFDAPGVKAWGVSFHKTIMLLLALVAAAFVAVELTSIFACVPVVRRWNKAIHGTCVDADSYAALNIASDIIIFILPVPLIIRLQIPTRQKVALALIFSLGAFLCITLIVRMTPLDTTSKTPDATYGGSLVNDTRCYERVRAPDKPASKKKS